MNLRIRPIPDVLVAVAIVAAAAGGMSLRAQEPQGNAPSAQEPKAAPKDDGVDARVRQLGSETFRERQQAEKALRAMGKDALPALRAAAEQDGDAEVQWRARRLIRQIEESDGGALAPRMGGAKQAEADSREDLREPHERMRAILPQGMPEDVQRRFDELFLNLERDFGMDIPRARFFDDSFFRDLQQQIDDMKKGLGSSAFGEGRSMSMQMGPDGVKVEIKTKNDQGEEQTKVYEAPDMETFRQKYPGVLDDAGMGGGFSFTLPNGRMPSLGQGLQRLRVLGPRNWGGQVTEPPAIDFGSPVPPSGARLGVSIRPEVSEDLLLHLGIDGAIAVESVQKGTLAEALGIQPLDLVARIGDKPIRSAADVQAALLDIEAGEDVAVTVWRKGKECQLTAKKPAADAVDSKGKDDGDDATSAPLHKRGEGR